MSHEKANESKIAGVIISHPDKLYYPEINITKMDVALYYHRYLDLILPYIINRPLAIVRCPEGVGHSCFFQKHIESLPKTMGHVTVQQEKGSFEHIVIKNEKDLISLIQNGTLELHVWGALAGNIEKPDQIMFDLDPGENVTFKQLIDCAMVLKAGLETLNLQSFVKTSGKKGLHIFVPIKKTRTWDEVKKFARSMAEHMERIAPDDFIVNMNKEKRKGKIFIDYIRNTKGAVCIAPYSTRTTSNASISIPLAWEELKTLKSSDEYGVLNIAKRLMHLKKDPWKGYFALKQFIPTNIFK